MLKFLIKVVKEWYFRSGEIADEFFIAAKIVFEIQAVKNDQKARLGRNCEYEHGDVLTYVRRCMY